MVAGAFPVFKLVSLFIKQIAKPLAVGMKRGAKESPFFKTYVCIPPAQAYHWLETNIRMRLLGSSRITEVTPLNEEVAVNLGAELLGEAIIFTVGTGLLYFEYKRGQRKEQKKEDTQNGRLSELEYKVQEMGLLVETQSAQIRELTRAQYAEKKS